MTAPTPTTGTPATDPGGATAPGDQASPGTGPHGTAPGDQASPGTPATDRGHSGEHVRSSSRDDDAPQQPRDPAQRRTDRQQPPGTDPGTDTDPGEHRPADWHIEDLPAGAQKLIADLRKEAAGRRTEAQDNKKRLEEALTRAKAGDERFASATEAFMRALGLTPEPDEPERSPEELVGELTGKYRQARVELAVYRAAAEHDADPDGLLDSRAFLAALADLDPGDDEFDNAIADAIGDAVQRNPKLRADQPETVPAWAGSAPSGGDFGGGLAERNGPDEWSVDDFRRQRANAGNGRAAGSH